MQLGNHFSHCHFPPLGCCPYISLARLRLMLALLGADQCALAGSLFVFFQLHCLPQCFGGNLCDKVYIPKVPRVRTHPTTTRGRNLQFRGAVSTGFFEFSPVDFSPFLQWSFPLLGFLCNLVRKWPQIRRKLPDFWAEKKA